MTVENMIAYLRLNVSIQDPNGVTQDSAYLSMTDEQILLYLNIVRTRDFSEVYSLEYLPEADVYPLILLTKKELYYALAAQDAPLFDMGADNNNYIKRSQRFSHYMTLIEQVDKEYGDYLENGGGNNTLTSFDVLLSDRYSTRYNQESGAVPNVTVMVMSVTDTIAEVAWRVRLDRFFSYKVYVSTSPIVDMYSLVSKISPDADLVATIQDVHQTQCRIENLLPNTQYYIAVSATEMSSLTGYRQVVITTQESG